MADSIFELVMANLATTLAGITTGNGYEISPLVRRHGTDKNPPSPNVSPSDNSIKTIELRLVETGVELVRKVTGKDWYYVHFIVVGMIQQSESTSTSTDTIINQIIASVRKVLMVDPQRGTFTGGSNPLAADTMIDDAETLAKEAAGFEGCQIPGRVFVRTAADNPYSQ